MDWTSPSNPTPKKSSKKAGKTAKAKKSRRPSTQKAAGTDKTLAEKIQSALTEPTNAWSVDFQKALGKLKTGKPQQDNEVAMDGKAT